jgi:hypothetical protein
MKNQNTSPHGWKVQESKLKRLIITKEAAGFLRLFTIAYEQYFSTQLY